MDALEYFLEYSHVFEVNKHKKEDLYLVNIRDGVGIDWGAPHVRDVGGLVIDKDSNIVTRTYGKIFNINELSTATGIKNSMKKLYEIKNSDDSVKMEKIDGHLIAISQYKGDLLFTSKTEFNGKIVHEAKMWFNKNLTPMQKRAVEDLTKKNTLLFDYVSPKEKVVIEYPKSELILHGIINNETGKDIFEKHVFEKIAKNIGVDTVNRFNLDYDMIERVLKQGYKEDMIRGFVIRTKDGQRFSIETSAYKKRKG